MSQLQEVKVLKKALKTALTAAVVAGRGQGKTSLCYKLLEESDKNKYWFHHPKPNLLRKAGVKNCYDFGEMVRLEDAAVIIDEPDLVLPLTNSKNKQALQILLTISRHRNLTLVFATSNTRYFTIREEAFIDLWLIKSLDYDLVKRGSPIKNAINKHFGISPESFSLKKNEYLLYGQDKELNGIHTFKLPGWWSEEHSRPYSDKLYLKDRKKVVQLLEEK